MSQPTPARERVAFVANEEGVLRIEVDGRTIGQLQLQVGCEVFINLNHFYSYKTTVGSRGRYGQSQKRG